MAAKRPNALDAVRLAAQPKPGARKSASKTPATADTLTTAIHIRRDHWELLRRAAFARAENTGGRASVSAVITELVESNRAKLEKAAG